MEKIKVTFHRTCEIDKKQVIEKLNEEYPGGKFADDEIKAMAEKIALDLFSEEMVYFESTADDFVSSTIEIIEQ
jgi:hypothetical protein